MIRLLAVAALVACSGGHSKTLAHPEPTPPDGDRGSQAVAEAPTEQECDALFAHTIKISAAERPADKLTDAEQRAMLADMRANPQVGSGCRAMTRARFACALDAPTTTAMKACK